MMLQSNLGGDGFKSSSRSSSSSSSTKPTRFAAGLDTGDLSWIGQENSNQESIGNDNMGPGRTALAIHASPGGCALQRSLMVWGLISRNGTTAKPLEDGAAKHYRDSQFNCVADGTGGMRGEDKDALGKVGFTPLAGAFQKLLDKGQSCVVPLDGFYEWVVETKLEGGEKQPYYIHSKGNAGPLLVAGLWKDCVVGDGRVFKTFTLLTTAACPSICGEVQGGIKIHSRMPVLLTQEAACEWLIAPSKGLMTKFSKMSTKSDVLEHWPVSKKMSNVRNRVSEPWKEVRASTSRRDIIFVV